MECPLHIVGELEILRPCRMHFEGCHVASGSVCSQDCELSRSVYRLEVAQYSAPRLRRHFEAHQVTPERAAPSRRPEKRAPLSSLPSSLAL